MPSLLETDVPSDSYETVPIPTDEARDREPIWLEFVSEFWNNNRLQLRMFWNAGLGDYILWFETVQEESLGTLVGPTRLELHRPYQYRDWLRLIFIDETDSHREIRPSRLGDSIQCTIWPGPNNPEFEEYDAEPGGPWDLVNTVEPWKPLLDYEPGAEILS